jgi:midasin (ATPase involved in ribosome maturation)
MYIHFILEHLAKELRYQRWQKISILYEKQGKSIQKYLSYFSPHSIQSIAKYSYSNHQFPSSFITEKYITPISKTNNLIQHKWKYKGYDVFIDCTSMKLFIL